MAHVTTQTSRAKFVVSLNFGFLVLGAFGAFAVSNPFVTWKMPIVAPVVHGPLVIPLVLAAEAVAYFLPISILIRTRGAVRCLGYLAALVVGRALVCLGLLTLDGGRALAFGLWWEGWLSANAELLAFKYCWASYLAVPACQILWITFIVSCAVWHVTRRRRRSPTEWLRLTAPVLIGAACVAMVLTGWREQARGYPAKTRLEHAAAEDLRYVQHEVAMFRRRCGAYPLQLEDLLRPRPDPPTVGLDAEGERVPLDPDIYPGPDPCPDAFQDTLAADGNLWAYATRPPGVGAVRTRARGRTVAYGVPYSGIGSLPQAEGLTRGYYSGNTNLHLAVEYGDVKTTTRLLDYHADPNVVNALGETPLHRAADCGATVVARLLLEHGADLHAVDSAGYAPLHCAVARGHLEVAGLLLEHGADVNALAADGLTPLHVAGEWGAAESIPFLVDHGADVNARADGGGTPLHKAAGCGETETVRLLLQHGADADATNQAGETALGRADARRYNETASILREHGATE